MLGMVGEGGGWAGGGGGFVAEVHGGNETVAEGEDVEDFAVGEDVAVEALDELVDADAELGLIRGARFFGDGEGIDVGVEFGPLAGPVGTDLGFADDVAAFGGFGPGDVVGHEGEGGVDVTTVEGGVGLSDQGMCVWHESLP